MQGIFLGHLQNVPQGIGKRVLKTEVSLVLRVFVDTLSSMFTFQYIYMYLIRTEHN